MRLPATKAYFDTYALAAVLMRAEYHARRPVPGVNIYTLLAAAHGAAVVVYGGVDLGGLGGLEIPDQVGHDGPEKSFKFFVIH